MSKHEKIEAAKQAKALAKKIGKSVEEVKACKQYIMQASCGCCDETLYFKSDENAANAAQAAGLNCFAIIVDDLGISHENMDTFYGMRKSEKD